MASLSTLARLQIALGLNTADVAKGATVTKAEMSGVREEAATTQNAVARSFNDASKSSDDFGNAVNSLHSRFREFGRTGSEIGRVAAAIGDDFGIASGEAIRFGSDIGLVVTAFADLGPAAARSAAGVLGLGQAAAAATPEVAGLGAAADATAAGGIGTLASVLGALAVPVAAVAAVGAGFVVFEQAANSEAARTNETINKQRFAVSDLHGTIADFTGEAQRDLPQVASDFDAINGHVDESSRTLKAWGGIVEEELTKNSRFFHQFTTDAQDTGAGLDQIGANAIAAASGLDTTHSAAIALKTALDDLPRDISIKVDISLFGTGAGALSQGFTQPLTAGGGSVQGTPPPVPFTTLPTGTSQVAEERRNLQEAIDAAHRALVQNNDPAQVQALERAYRNAREALANFNAEQARQAALAKQQAADEARRKAEADARALAQAQVAAGNEAFDQLSRAAHKYFDDLHQANLKAISDARNRADQEIEEQKRANQQPIDDANKAFKAIQDARRLAQLQADVANAQNPDDLRAAQQALSDFIVQQQIDQMQATADAENAKLDIKKGAQDADFANQAQAENDRYNAQVTAFDENLAELRKYLSKHPAEWKKATDAVIATLKAAGIDYNQAGKDNATAYLDGVRAAFGGATSSGLATGRAGRTFTVGPRVSSTDIGSIGHLTEGLSYAGGGAPGDVYLDGEKVGIILDRRTGRLQGIYAPQPAAPSSGTR